MAETWFISDTHFGHENILKFEPEARPFKNLVEMHEALINRWNSVVGHDDTVYHLGDVAFGLINLELVKFLKGNKRLVLGNHDKYPLHNYSRHFCNIYGIKFWNGCLLSHAPCHTNQLEYRAVANIHGHMHSKKLDDVRYINVSVEQNNLTPINADIILQRVKDNERCKI